MVESPSSCAFLKKIPKIGAIIRWPSARTNEIPLKGGVHGSAHVHESKNFFAFARYDPSLFNLICCL